MIHICGQITFWKICLKLNNIFRAKKFMVYAYEKKDFKCAWHLIEAL